jgi:hypothetical protein
MAPAYAAAEDPDAMAGTVSVTPAGTTPGGEVDLRVSGCEGKTGTAKSEVFVDEVPLARVAEGLVGDARVSSAASPGSYAITVDCDGASAVAEGTLQVGTATAAPTASPSAPVRAGGGAMAAERPPAQAAGPPSHGGGLDRLQSAGLVLAGGAALALTGRALHRRRTGHGRARR